MYSAGNVDLFLNGYNDRMKHRIDNSIFDDLDSLDIFYTHTKEVDISSACVRTFRLDLNVLPITS